MKRKTLIVIIVLVLLFVIALGIGVYVFVSSQQGNAQENQNNFPEEIDNSQQESDNSLDEDPEPEIDGERYNYPEYGISFIVPDGWSYEFKILDDGLNYIMEKDDHTFLIRSYTPSEDQQENSKCGTVLRKDYLQSNFEMISSRDLEFLRPAVKQNTISIGTVVFNYLAYYQYWKPVEGSQEGESIARCDMLLGRWAYKIELYLPDARNINKSMVLEADGIVKSIIHE